MRQTYCCARSLSQGALFNAVVRRTGMGSVRPRSLVESSILSIIFPLQRCEGAHLRESGIQNYSCSRYVDEEEYESILAYDLDMVLYDEEIAKLADFVIAGAIRFAVQIKIDTGHSRLGFRADDAFFK